MVVKLLPLDELSIYVDLTNCYKSSHFAKVLCELCCYLKNLGYPKIKTSYFKYEVLTIRNNIYLKSFLTSLSERLNFIELDEFTFEVNPKDITPLLLGILNDFFVSRVSLDVKSFSPKFLGIMGVSNVSLKNINLAIDNIRKFNFDLNIDLNINIPYQEKRHLKLDLMSLVGCAPEHICLSEITIDESNFISNDVFKDDVCDNSRDKAEDFWFYALDLLEASGYINYEISNFALKGYESKHNLRYWELKPYLGVGINSVSLLSGIYRSGLKAIIRKGNNFLSGEVSFATFEILSGLDFFVYHFMTNFGIKKGLDVSLLELKFNYEQEDFAQFIDYLLNLNKAVVLKNNFLYLDGHERFKLDFYLRLIREYLIDTSFKVSLKFL
ncbi:HemN-related non-iron pseudo-SAM protein PsgB [Borrelia sp. BU AG58]|uniref:HemN-related non-iron pseudo-SAM protein PsgB n=1 Tax=Borrelia sp. BU AG58 TaxID=2887345 RepID=UPI001E5BF925|nr:HemN-related non-iron pseudo-SAM protein PsgB [Borrelia sp. BU AG58]UER67806.1 HemN-related non-iron pseudo-SAM protein PsgB [Borrelia sp. BU AG58]